MRSSKRRALLLVGFATVAVLAACNLLVSPEDLTGDTIAPNDATIDNATIDGSATDDTLSSGLVAYWSFDETEGLVAHDQSDGGKSPAALEGLVSWDAGKVRGAIAFAGDASCARVAENGRLQLSEQASISFWANIAAVGPDSRIVEKQYAYYVKMNGRSPQFNGGGGYGTMNMSMPVNEWHHVVFTFDRGDLHGYYDGTEVQFSAYTLDAGAVLRQDDNGITIGNEKGLTTPVNGRLDELRIYNRVLTLAEIEALAK